MIAADNPNIAALRAAEDLLREHDARIAAATEDLKQLRKDRLPKAERVQACIDVLCGRATPDLFTPPADVPVSEPVVVVSPQPPAEPDVTPPLAPGEYVELDAVRAAKLGDIAALQTPDLEPIVDWLLRDTETETVGDLWDWINEDYDGMRHAGITAMLRKRGPKEYAKHAQAFADAVMMFIVNNGHGPAEGMAEVLGMPAPGPIVCKPVGEGLLRDIDGITAADADKLEENGLRTLADLEQRIKEKLVSFDLQTDSLNTQIYKVLVLPKGLLSGPDADRVANAITRHLNPVTVTVADQEPEAEPAEHIEDLTAEEEARVSAKPTKSPGDLRKLEAMAAWRRRQAAGDTKPVWGMWSEFAVYLTDGRMVAVLYDPGDGGVEFHGEATSTTGYQLVYSKLSNGHFPKKPLEAWAKDKAEELAREVKKEKAEAAKRRLKAPPKSAAKPKTKGKVKA